MMISKNINFYFFPLPILRRLVHIDEQKPWKIYRMKRLELKKNTWIASSSLFYMINYRFYYFMRHDL